ncbi:MAG: AGE family epimerase/isomerase [Anaerolineae bacterium]
MAMQDCFLEAGELRIRAVSLDVGGWRIEIQRRENDDWHCLAYLPAEEHWLIYTSWENHWFAKLSGIAIQRVGINEPGTMLAEADAVVDGHPWRLTDRFSLQHGLVRIERTYTHTDPRPQSPITLVNRIRLPYGTDGRMLIPGNLYNGNPSSTKPGPAMDLIPGSIALYEEHRLPIPMVNVESTVDGVRQFGTFISEPNPICQGHLVDQWWSLGLQYGPGWVDLVSASGPVATNSQLSTIYGHRWGFDPYDEAFLDIPGPVSIHKVLYLDTGIREPIGYSFRRSLWQAFELFQPISTPHLPLPDVVELKTTFAKSMFVRDERDAVGYLSLPWKQFRRNLLQWGWCGGNLSNAYAFLSLWALNGDSLLRDQAMQTIAFFIEHAPALCPGMFYLDYDSDAGFHRQVASSVQFGDVLYLLADLVRLGRRLQLLEAEAWYNCLLAGCDFLLRSTTYHGMWPKAWAPDFGAAIGLPPDATPPSSELSTSGAYCIPGLVAGYRLSSNQNYLQRAIEALEGYWQHFGADQSVPFWGATLDAGAEDKEAGYGVFKAALEVWEVTGDARYLSWAQRAADWCLTWLQMWPVPLRAQSELVSQMNTVGWTFISTQNQELDCFGYWMAWYYWRLASALGDERYAQLARVLYHAPTQTISRPGVMLGHTLPGIQGEHYNHTNCTYIVDAPWRGYQGSVGMNWVTAAALYGGVKLNELAPGEFPLINR